MVGNLILDIFHAIDTYQQVNHHQIASVLDFKSTASCFDNCPLPSLVNITTKKMEYTVYYRILSVVKGTEYDANILLKHHCIVLC